MNREIRWMRRHLHRLGWVRLALWRRRSLQRAHEFFGHPAPKRKVKHIQPSGSTRRNKTYLAFSRAFFRIFCTPSNCHWIFLQSLKALFASFLYMMLELWKSLAHAMRCTVVATYIFPVFSSLFETNGALVSLKVEKKWEKGGEQTSKVPTLCSSSGSWVVHMPPWSSGWACWESCLPAVDAWPAV